MKSHFLRSLAVFLTLAMLIQLLPVQVLAVGEDEFTPEDVVLSEESEDIIAPFEELAAEESMPADISFEVEALREENIKQFRMNDGSYIAVQYATPVHYEDENGQWQDIDNTLYFDSVNTAKVYSARNGQEHLSFAANLQGGDLRVVTCFLPRLAIILSTCLCLAHPPMLRRTLRKRLLRKTVP